MMSVLQSGHKTEVLKEMMNMFREQCMVDCILAAEGKYIKAHSVVLSSCSPFFKLLLCEEKRNEPIIILRGVTYNDLVNIVEFIYSGCVDVPDEEWNSFISTAQYLQIGGLIELSEVAISRNENITRFEESDDGRRVDIPFDDGGRFERNNDVDRDAVGSRFTEEPSESDTTSCSSVESSESDTRSCTSVESRSESIQVNKPRVIPNDLERSDDYQSDGRGPKLEQQNQRELEQVKNHCLSNMDSNKEHNESHEVNPQHLTQVGGGGEEVVRTPARNMEGVKTCVVGGSNEEHESSQNKVLKSMGSQNEVEAGAQSTMSPTQAASDNQDVEKRVVEGRKNLKRKEVQDILEVDVCEEINEAESQTVKPPKIYKCKDLAHTRSQVCTMHSVTKHPLITPNEKQVDAEKGEKCSKTHQNLSVRLVRLQQLDNSQNPRFAVAPNSRGEHEEQADGEAQGNTACEDCGPSPSTIASQKEDYLSIGRKCSVCSRVFRGASHLSSHMLNHSPEGALSQSRTASSTTSAQKVAVPRQMKRRIKQEKHLCCEGNEQPSPSAGSSAHEISKPQSCDGTVAEIRPNSHPFDCGECGVSFRQKMSLIQHMQMHRDKNLLCG